MRTGTVGRCQGRRARKAVRRFRPCVGLLCGLLLGACGGGDSPATPPKSPDGWDLLRVPVTSAPLGTDRREDGVVVLRLSEGEGQPLPPTMPVVMQIALHTTEGTRREMRTDVAFNLQDPQHPKGLRAGLEGIRLFERRRILVPAHLGYGAKGRPRAKDRQAVPPHSDLVYDLRPVRLRKEDLRKGTGPAVTRYSTVTVHYTGTLPDGTVFDSSHKKGKPATFSVQGVIEGWTLGLPGMRVGGVRKLWVPWHLAYKEAGSPGRIPPYTDLSFEVELLDAR